MSFATKAYSVPGAFSSVDSFPVAYARELPVWKAPCVLALFTILSAVQIILLRYSNLKWVFPTGDYLPEGIYSGSHPISFRVFIGSFIVSFCLFWADSTRRRITLTIHALSYCVVGWILLDSVLFVLRRTTGFELSLTVAEILSGLLGFALYSLTILENGALPSPISIRQRGRWSYMRHSVLVGLLILLTAIVATIIHRRDLLIVKHLKNVALLGGIGPGVFLLLPLFFLLLFALAHLRRSFLRRRPSFVDVSVIIPAFNEEHSIADAIRALDRAGEGYGGKIIVLVIDNASQDATAIRAREALANCKNVVGRVIHEARAGKSFALNRGLAEVNTDFVIRVDADTRLQPRTIARAMIWFADDRVGVVGGLPLTPDAGPFDNARQIETLVKHGYYSVALEAIGGVIGVPGMFAVYRTQHLRALGGFATGMNGEDTDITLRISERGYRVVVDASIGYISEVPVTLQHMREQRMRWFRSIFHVSSRGRQIILGAGRSIRGKIVLPFMLINSARRAMMIPLIIFGLLELSLGSGLEGLLRWQAVIAVILGSSVLVAILAALVNRRWRALFGLPDYFVFRVLRSYFTLEALLSIIVMPKRVPFRL